MGVSGGQKAASEQTIPKFHGWERGRWCPPVSSKPWGAGEAVLARWHLARAKIASCTWIYAFN